MTDADAEWLRERPEIVTACDEGMGEFAEEHGGTDECTDFNMTAAGLARALPLLRAAIRADVVRELFEPRICLNCGRSEACMTEADLKSDEEAGVPCTFDPMPPDWIAAAHAQGRAAGREEAAKMADAKAQELYRIGFCNVEASLADNIATAIRSLP